MNVSSHGWQMTGVTLKTSVIAERLYFEIWHNNDTNIPYSIGLIVRMPTQASLDMYIFRIATY
jgi:hypothetical protein